MSSRTFVSATLKGSTLLGRIGAPVSSTATIEGEPQKSQFCAVRFSSKTDTALHARQRTVFFAAAHPRWSSGIARNAATRSFSSTSVPSAFNSAGETVPQYGQTSACFDGVHTASAPQAGQLNLLRAVISDMRRKEWDWQVAMLDHLPARIKCGCVAIPGRTLFRMIVPGV